MKKKSRRLLCLVLLLGLCFTDCSKEVEVDTKDLDDIRFDGDDTAVMGEDYSVELTAPENYEIIPDSVYVEIDGDELKRGWEFDAQSGELTIDGDRISGDITIGAEVQESLIGTWTGSIDITDFLNAKMEAAGAGAYFQFADLALKVTMTFTDDGTCTLAVDEAAIPALTDSIKEQMMGGVEKLLKEQLAANNIDMTVEEALAQSGMTMEEVVEQAAENAQLTNAFSGIEKETRYLAKAGLLYMDEDPESLPDSGASPYKLSNGTLTIRVSQDDEDSEYAPVAFPLVLKRAD